MVSSRFHILFFASVCIVAVLGSSSDAAVISSTVNQDGYKTFAGSGAASKVGTFQFGPAAPSYTQARLRTWIELPANAFGPAAPKLVLAAYNASFPEFSLIFGPTVSTSLKIESQVPPTFGVDERQTGWVSLTPTEGTTLASIIANDSQGRIDAWLVSPTIQDFANPDSFEYWYFDSNFNIIFETIVFTATLELEAVPEPTSAIAVSGLTFGFLALRRARARRLLRRQIHA